LIFQRPSQPKQDGLSFANNLAHDFRCGPTSDVKIKAARRGGIQELAPLMELEIKPYHVRTSPEPADYTHLSRLSVKYALFGLWQSSEDQDQSAPMISF
jgi:hypothetical protein